MPLKTNNKIINTSIILCFPPPPPHFCEAENFILLDREESIKKKNPYIVDVTEADVYVLLSWKLVMMVRAW